MIKRIKVGFTARQESISSNIYLNSYKPLTKIYKTIQRSQRGLKMVLRKPRRTKLLTLLAGPHINKKARIQLNMASYKAFIINPEMEKYSQIREMKENLIKTDSNIGVTIQIKRLETWSTF